jgi:hypothetical protein
MSDDDEIKKINELQARLEDRRVRSKNLKRSLAELASASADNTAPMLDEDEMKMLEGLKARMEEPLDPDLMPYIVHNTFGQFVAHPLIHSPLLIPGNLNALYRQKTAALAKARAACDWHSFIMIHERPYRLDALQEILNDADDLTPGEYWGLIRQVWTDSENIWQNYDLWVEVWQSGMPFREDVMQEPDQAAYKALPDIVPVWRGVSREDGAAGMSWSTDKTKAEWFAYRFSSMDGRLPFLVEGQVQKTDILAYFTGRGESEVVALPEAVEDIKLEMLPRGGSK